MSGIMRTATLGLLLLSITYGVRGEEYKLEAGADFEAECLMKVGPGDSCYLEKGDYEHDGLTRVHGTEDERITIRGHPEACIKGSNTQDRVFQVAHDYYTIEDICFDGKHGSDYVSTAIYALGADRKSDIKVNGIEVKSSVTGLLLRNLEIKNFGSECIHFRYFVTWAEMEGCTVQHCGIDAFENGNGGKVGEALYIGTALDQVDDSKAPEVKLRTGSADNVDADVCSYNWIHHNTFRTYGNECVDVKEGSTMNLIENNVCEQQRDPNSGCFGLRGSENTVRYNEIAECYGAGVRIGGDKDFGGGNHMYGNIIKNTGNGAFNIMTPDQGVVCENSISGATSAEGAYKDDPEFELSSSTGDCETYPGSLDGSNDSAPPESAPTDDDDNEGLTDDDEDIGAGVNGNEDDTSSEIITLNTAGGEGIGDCDVVLPIAKMEIEHPQYVDTSNDPDNLFDGDMDTYYSVHRETTKLTFELEGEFEVNGVSIGFFMKNEDEERIQTFDIAVKEDGGDWYTVQSRQESSGEFEDMQHFPFSSRTATYVRFESHGNTFNNWTPLTEFEVCGSESALESNALFGVDEGVKKTVEHINAELTLCPNPSVLAPVKTRLHGGSGNVAHLFDGNFQTRWSTDNTYHANDLDNDKVQVTLVGDSYISHVKIAFFDGHLAHQHFAIYTESATAKSWHPALPGAIADKNEGLQTFTLNLDKVTHIYIVGNGNDVGDFTKISELEVYGC